MAQRFLGGIFGNTVPSTADQPAISGVYDLNGQYYMSKEGGGLNLELAQRKARNLPTSLGEYFTASKAGTDLGKVRDATNQATRDGLFGEGLDYKGKIDKKKYDTISEFIADKENFKGDGVYNVGGEAVVIQNGRVVSRVVIQAKADKEGFFS